MLALVVCCGVGGREACHSTDLALSTVLGYLTSLDEGYLLTGLKRFYTSLYQLL